MNFNQNFLASLGITPSKPHTFTEYEMVDKQGGGLTNTLKNYLYIKVSNLFGNADVKNITSKTFKGCYAFMSNDVFPSGDPIYSTKDKDIINNVEYLCDMNGKKVIPVMGCEIMGVGIYNDDYNYIWLKDGNFHVRYAGGSDIVPFSHTYVCWEPKSGAIGQEKYRRFDYIYREMNAETFHDTENQEELVELSVHISEVNAKYAPLLQQEINKSEKQAKLFEPSLLIPEVEIRCLDGSFMFYPHSLPVTPVRSRFSKSSWDEPFITLDYEINDVKELFSIYLSKKLPSTQSLIHGGLLAICYGLSDYLGMGFYANYFGEIIHSIPFARIVFPVKGSVEDYTELFTGLNVETVYKEFFPEAQTVNFYVAMNKLGLSVNFLAKSMQYNSSPYLMEFLESK